MEPLEQRQLLELERRLLVEIDLGVGEELELEQRHVVEPDLVVGEEPKIIIPDEHALTG